MTSSSSATSTTSPSTTTPSAPTRCWPTTWPPASRRASPSNRPSYHQCQRGHHAGRSGAGHRHPAAELPVVRHHLRQPRQPAARSNQCHAGYQEHQRRAVQPPYARLDGDQCLRPGNQFRRLRLSCGRPAQLGDCHAAYLTVFAGQPVAFTVTAQGTRRSPTSGRWMARMWRAPLAPATPTSPNWTPTPSVAR